MRPLKMLDLLSPLELLELLRDRRRARGFDGGDIGRHVADTGAPEAADRFDHFLRDLDGDEAIFDALEPHLRKLK